MSRRALLFARQALRDGLRPRLLVAVLVPYLGVAAFLAFALAEGAPGDLGSAPLYTQEQALLERYSQLAFVWLTAFPMVIVAVLVASLVAGDLESGTARVLLSKPLGRWELLLGTALGVIAVALAIAVVGLLVGAAALVFTTGVSAQAITGGILAILPGAVVYALLLTTFVTALGVLAAVRTADRLQTALLTAVVPVLFFAFVFVRVLPVGGIYETLHLYVIDVNYQLGNAFVAIQEATGTSFEPATQDAFATVSGVYDTAAAWEDPLLGGMAGSVPLSGYVPPVASVGAVGVLAVGLAAAAVYRFERMDVP